MDNDIYNKIADYQDYVHLEQPAGGAVEIEKLKGGKMKKERIEEIKRNLNNPNQSYYAGEGESMWKDLKEAIAEIESLEVKIKELDIGLIARNLLKQENEQLKAVCEAAKDLLQSIAWCCAKYPNIIKIPERIQEKCKHLQQALAAKDKDV